MFGCLQINHACAATAWLLADCGARECAAATCPKGARIGPCLVCAGERCANDVDACWGDPSCIDCLLSCDGNGACVQTCTEISANAQALQSCMTASCQAACF